MKQYKVSAVLVYGNDESTIKDSIDSILGQSFPNIEAICVNNGSEDESENIVKSAASIDDRIKLIKLPEKNDIQKAYQLGLGIAAGRFIIFLNAREKLNIDIVKELYYKPPYSYSFEENHLYRRTFLENDEEITEIINKRIELDLKKASEEIGKKKEEMNSSLDNFEKITAENIKNSTYELSLRFNQLEKLFYEKDYEYKQIIENTYKQHCTDYETDKKQIYEDFTKIYEYIKSEINKKGCEINRLYEEINKNYHYTEDLISKKAGDNAKISDEREKRLYNKISELEKDIVLRYVNLKRIFDMQFDETDSRIKSMTRSERARGLKSFETVDIEKNVSANLDNVYSVLNKNSAAFYEELSNIYKEINEKLNKQRESEQYLFNKKLSELKDDFDKKLQSLKEEINGKL